MLGNSAPLRFGTLKDPFAYPKSIGKFQTVDSGNTLTAPDIVQRIILNRLQYEHRNRAKEAKELALLSANAAKTGLEIGINGDRSEIFSLE